MPSAAETGDAFGSSVSLGDVNGDGYADLAVGVPGESTDHATTTGAVTLLYGSASGLTTKGAKNWTQNSPGVPDTEGRRDRFGGRVSLTDHTGDGLADLTVSAPGKNNGAGAVWFLRSTTSGPSTTGATAFGPATTGVSTAGTPGYGTVLNG
ncbi:FG-GAP repeat protein [Streptomyces sp. CRN 30]|uniref:FG-GAP repeat protein n=1 Tax=Streptomyces sp. CRN 30 TaxID=3075613 RepID=UPI002A806C61|nr:FG-GAP repeat protein [Streptomyces sp. CRN 30]